MSSPEDIIVCIPVYNDWESVQLLLAQFEQLVNETGLGLSVLLVDDASSQKPQLSLAAETRLRVDILELRRNVGHQRAITLGLTHLYQTRQASAVVVMDADGEDRVEDIAALHRRFEELGRARAVFAARRRRTEGLTFQLGYRAYQGLHWCLTGERVEVGNFSILPWEYLTTLVVVSEMWSHYAAAVRVSKLPTEQLPLDRGYRLRGQSKMNLVSLVTHGLRAILAYEQVSVRIMAGSIGLSLLALLFALPLAFVSIGAPWLYLGLLAIATLVLVSGTFVLVTLQARSSSQFIPLRDFQYFVLGSYRLSPPRT